MSDIVNDIRDSKAFGIFKELVCFGGDVTKILTTVGDISKDISDGKSIDFKTFVTVIYGYKIIGARRDLVLNLFDVEFMEDAFKEFAGLEFDIFDLDIDLDLELDPLDVEGLEGFDDVIDEMLPTTEEIDEGLKVIYDKFKPFLMDDVTLEKFSIFIENCESVVEFIYGVTDMLKDFDLDKELQDFKMEGLLDILSFLRGYASKLRTFIKDGLGYLNDDKVLSKCRVIGEDIVYRNLGTPYALSFATLDLGRISDAYIYLGGKKVKSLYGDFGQLYLTNTKFTISCGYYKDLVYNELLVNKVGGVDEIEHDDKLVNRTKSYVDMYVGNDGNGLETVLHTDHSFNSFSVEDYVNDKIKMQETVGGDEVFDYTIPNDAITSFNFLKASVIKKTLAEFKMPDNSVKYGLNRVSLDYDGAKKFYDEFKNSNNVMKRCIADNILLSADYGDSTITTVPETERSYCYISMNKLALDDFFDYSSSDYGDHKFIYSEYIAFLNSRAWLNFITFISEDMIGFQTAEDNESYVKLGVNKDLDFSSEDIRISFISYMHKDIIESLFSDTFDEKFDDLTDFILKPLELLEDFGEEVSDFIEDLFDD